MLMFLATVVLLHSLTPGALAIDPLTHLPLTTQQVCDTKWSLVPRTLTEKQKQQAFERYHVPLAERHLMVIDHEIPLLLGGSETDPRNVWPQLKDESYRKDAIERQLHAMVCGTHPWARPVMPLQEAQRRIVANWKRATVIEVKE